MRQEEGHRFLRKPQLGNNFLKSGIVSKAALGPASGDLSGAVAASILGVAPGANGTTVFTVQHHWVTDAGHAIFFKLVEATVAPVALGFLALSRTKPLSTAEQGSSPARPEHCTLPAKPT